MQNYLHSSSKCAYNHFVLARTFRVLLGRHGLSSRGVSFFLPEHPTPIVKSFTSCGNLRCFVEIFLRLVRTAKKRLPFEGFNEPCTEA